MAIDVPGLVQSQFDGVSPRKLGWDAGIEMRVGVATCCYNLAHSNQATSHVVRRPGA